MKTKAIAEENKTFEDICEITEYRNALVQQALMNYEPLVNDLIISKTKNVNQICSILDRMLDFCFDESMVSLHRRLTTYLYNINKGAAVFQIDLFREMWDDKTWDFSQWLDQ